MILDQREAIAGGEARAGNGGSGVRSTAEGVEGAGAPVWFLTKGETIAGGEKRVGTVGVPLRSRGRGRETGTAGIPLRTRDQVGKK